MNILQVCAFGAPKPGNFIATLSRLQKVLESDGHKVIYVFVERARNQEWCVDLAKSSKVYYLPEKAARLNPNIYKEFRRIYKENQIDIVHSHFELFDIPATLMAPKNTKVFWHLHDALKEIYERSPLSRKILNRLQYGVFSRRSILLSVSEEHAQFVKKLGFSKEQIYYIPNGIDCSRIALSSHNSGSDFLMFGWEVKRKSVDVAIKAMQLIEKEDKQIFLKIVGQSECKNYIDSCSCMNISAIEPVANVNDLYLTTKGFLHISRAEGQSYALLEAIYSGIPVVCSNIPENKFAQKFKNVYMVPVGDSAAVAKAIIKVNALKVDDDSVEYNRAIINDKYSIESWCTTIQSFYYANVDKKILLKYRLLK